VRYRLINCVVPTFDGGRGCRASTTSVAALFRKLPAEPFGQLAKLFGGVTEVLILFLKLFQALLTLLWVVDHQAS
jgi:hypothetical protein